MNTYTVHYFENYPKSKEDFEQTLRALTDKFVLLSPVSALIASDKNIKEVHEHFNKNATILNQYYDSFKSSKGEVYSNEIQEILALGRELPYSTD